MNDKLLFEKGTLAENHSHRDQHNSIAALESNESHGVFVFPTVDVSMYAGWKLKLEEQLDSKIEEMKKKVVDAQIEFDSSSVYIRGDFAWRKQVAALHVKVQGELEATTGSLAFKLKEDLQLLSSTIKENIIAHEKLCKSEIERHNKMYEDKLRRTRASLKKEIDRFASLEKCLRKEEVNQAKKIYSCLVEDMKKDHERQEERLHLALREYKIAYDTLELTYQQLVDKHQASKDEIDQLKQLIPKYQIANANRMQLTIPTTSSGVSDLYVQTLQQAVSSLNINLESMKKHIDEVTVQRDEYSKRIHTLEDENTKIKQDLAQAKQLLTESQQEMVKYQETLTKVEQDLEIKKESCQDLEFRVESMVLQIEDLNRASASSKEFIGSMTRELEEKSILLSQLEGKSEQIRMDFKLWRYTDGISHNLVQSVEAFLDLLNTNVAVADINSCDLTAQIIQKIETKLRFEFENIYGAQLNMRVSHERRRILERIEVLAQKRYKAPSLGEKGSRDKKKALIGSNTVPVSQACFKLMHQIVSESFDSLGFGEWTSTDVNKLMEEISSLQKDLKLKDLKIEELQRYLNDAKLAISKFDLMQREKEYLLVELTERYRQLRASCLGGTNGVTSMISPRREEEESLSVCAHKQALEGRKLRSRPVSASPLMNRLPAETNTVYKRPVTSAGSAHRKCRIYQSPNEPTLEIHTHEEHIRSVLKNDLMYGATKSNAEIELGNEGVDYTDFAKAQEQEVANIASQTFKIEL